MTDNLKSNLPKGKRLKLLKIKTSEFEINSSEFLVKDNKIYIGCENNKSLEILELQLEGSKPMNAKSFINGFIKNK